MIGRIVKGLSGLYTVKLESGDIVSCRARGKFRTKGLSPLAGDMVEVDKKSNVITDILPRRNALIRPPVANVERMFVVVATANPEPSLIVTDKLIAVCEENDIDPVIVINKTDIRSGEELKAIYEKAGFKVVCAFALGAEGTDEIKKLIDGKLCVLGGNSGVGKSSILNALGYTEKTGAVSEKTERGRHTTKRVELFELAGGFIADTPGFGDVNYEECLKAEKDGVAALFREFDKYFGKCRFADCAHINEPDCAVKAAVACGEIPQSRYDNYCAIYEESKNITEYR